MAVFLHSETGGYAFVSFKALYSRFTAATSWTELNVDPTPRELIRALFSGNLGKSIHLLRCPYRRTVSCFMDKYRKQPNRIDQQGFEWQHCHSILYPLLNISAESSAEEIAEKFLSFSFDAFIEALPSIYHLDAHFKPQHWSKRLLIGNRNRFCWPFCQTINIENKEALATIPGIDFSVKTNTTGHIDRDFELNDEHRKVIQRLYREDFALGEYPA
jgi:hypothetical protein